MGAGLYVMFSARRLVYCCLRDNPRQHHGMEKAIIMNKPIYQKEKTLLAMACVISALLWVTLIVLTKGAILLIFPFAFLGYLFAQSGFISYLKGTGALVSDTQFPDLQKRVRDCAAKVGLKTLPGVYILHGNGVFNAFATRFLRKDYIILLSDVLDALEDHPDAINFYIGHEMGHIDRKHLLVEPFLSLALVLPLLGAAYSRAREYTCDQYGAACCTPEAAQQGVALLAVGTKRYKTINKNQYIQQTRETSGFWMSFHELVASYPWLVKRFARITPGFRDDHMPKRNPFAYLFAIFVPRLSVMSVIVIYLLFIVLSADGMIKQFRNTMNAGSSAAIEGVPSSEEAALPESAAEWIELTVAEVNAAGPQQIDDVTTLDQARAGDDGRTMIYDYTISVDAAAVDFEAVRKVVLENSVSYWCHDPATQIFRDYKVAIVYHYLDRHSVFLGDITVDLADPQTCAIQQDETLPQP